MSPTQEGLHCGDFSTLTVFGLKPRSGTAAFGGSFISVSVLFCFFSQFFPSLALLVFSCGGALAVLISLGGVVSLEVEDI